MSIQKQRIAKKVAELGLGDFDGFKNNYGKYMIGSVSFKTLKEIELYLKGYKEAAEKAEAAKAIAEAQRIIIAKQAEQIVKNNGLDGMERGDHPVSHCRSSVWSIIIDLLNFGWSFERVNEWCRYSKNNCRFTLNGVTVR